jgi:Mn2+/Fe2+ NRAMP family transporter
MVGLVGQALHMAFPGVSPAIAGALGTLSSPLAEAVRQRPEHPWSIATALAAVLLLLSGGYKRLEWITTGLVAGVTLVTVLTVGLLAGTNDAVQLADIQQGFSLGVLSLPPAAIAAAFATFGITGVGASELYAYPYWCLEKGYARSTGRRSDDPAWAERARGWLRVMILDAWVSMLVYTVATVAFYFLGAALLHRHNLHPKGPQMIVTLAEMYVPTFGAWTKILFMIGAWAVLFKTLYVASAGHARLSADFLSLAKLVKYNQPHLRHRWIQRFCIFFPSLAFVLYLLFREPKMMVTVGGYAQAITIPIVSGAALYLRYFRTDPRLAPSRWSDLFLWLAFILITAVAVYAVINDVLPTLKQWLGY